MIKTVRDEDRRHGEWIQKVIIKYELQKMVTELTQKEQ